MKEGRIWWQCRTGYLEKNISVENLSTKILELKISVFISSLQQSSRSGVRINDYWDIWVSTTKFFLIGNYIRNESEFEYRKHTSETTTKYQVHQNSKIKRLMSGDDWTKIAKKWEKKQKRGEGLSSVSVCVIGGARCGDTGEAHEQNTREKNQKFASDKRT